MPRGASEGYCPEVAMPARSGSVTHQVVNQAPPFAGANLFTRDRQLRHAVERADASFITARATALGEYVGSAEAQHLAEAANRHAPTLRTHDGAGHRVDEVEYHPAYHALMEAAFSRGLHALPWDEPRPGAFAARATLFGLWNELENGTACPVTMTFAGAHLIRRAPLLAREWAPKLAARAYDPRPVPVGAKTAATVGMAMTEKQGGSDLRAITTVARDAGEGAFALTGHKWFCSAPMSDGFFTLARLASGEPTCFLVPRSLPDGTRNRFLIQRLKEKCGNRSNASAEIEYDGTLAWPVGEPGRGIATIIEMAHLTRFDIVTGSAGVMRAAFHRALHHARHRGAFGALLVDQPLMQAVLADLALESEAALLLGFRLAQAFDRAQLDEGERVLARALTPIAKYWVTRRAPALVTEAMECLGGNGYVEEGPLARLYREAPLNGIWEGSGNVICLDALRALARSPLAREVLLAEVEAPAREHPALAAHVRRVAAALPNAGALEPRARWLVEGLALAVQAALMVRHADAGAAAAFCAARLGEDGGLAFGALPAGVDAKALVARGALEQ
jgi:putative acyl-CoA dehydrogenase